MQIDLSISLDMESIRLVISGMPLQTLVVTVHLSSTQTSSVSVGVGSTISLLTGLSFVFLQLEESRTHGKFLMPDGCEWPGRQVV